MNPYEQILAGLPVGLDRAIGRLMLFHKGAANLIEREPMLLELQSRPGLEKTEDRTMRDSVHTLRSLGVRICHAEWRTKDERTGKVKVHFGYYLAANEEEYQAFRAKYLSYAKTIWQTIKSMDEKRPVISPTGELEPPREIEIQRSLF